jgi:DNA replication and repair protein RecF
MALARLEVGDFRCFKVAALDLDRRTTLITGENASGKTSLLEAVFLLSHGRSFRTGDLDRLHREGGDGFTVFGRVEGEGGRAVPMGVGRKQRTLELRLGGLPAKSLAELATTLPVQILDAEVHRLIEDGPKYRRRYVDWGLFHVEQRFLPTWRRYQRALRQRNEALKQRPARAVVLAWDEELSAAGDALDELRRSYVAELSDPATVAVRTVLGAELTFDYRRGWPGSMGLREALETAWPRDQATGQTHAGPHRADLLVNLAGHPAEERVSRGQQKLLAAALVIAQLRHVYDRTGRETTLLVDDLPAELDVPNIGRLLHLLQALPGQRVVTAISPDKVPGEIRAGARMFHVERGEVVPL